jgi:uncharacterized protein YkwD
MKKVVIAVLVLSVFGSIGLPLALAQNRNRDRVNAAQAHVYTPDELLAEANKLRADKGIQPLKLDARLNSSAQLKANDMLQHTYYGHDNPATGGHGYQLIFDNMDACKTGSENLNEILPGDDPFAGWKASPDHYAAEIGQEYDYTGFGYVAFNNKAYYVQHFCNVE